MVCSGMQENGNAIAIVSMRRRGVLRRRGERATCVDSNLDRLGSTDSGSKAWVSRQNFHQNPRRTGTNCSSLGCDGGQVQRYDGVENVLNTQKPGSWSRTRGVAVVAEWQWEWEWDRSRFRD